MLFYPKLGLIVLSKLSQWFLALQYRSTFFRVQSHCQFYVLWQ